MAEVISGPLRDWLEASAPSLNLRFLRFKHRHRSLDPDAVLALLAECLPPMAGDGEDGTSTLLASVFDLVLLHAGRGLLVPGGGSHPGIGLLLRETFPRLRRLLLQDPRSLPGALSNAVERVPRGADLARGLTRVGDSLRDGRQLLDAGAVLAWRLGEPRLRDDALAAAKRLPAKVALPVLGLDAWPEAAAPLAIAGLAADGWRRPEGLLTAETLRGLEGMPAAGVDSLACALAAPPPEPLVRWKLAGLACGFQGFDGTFAAPPLLLEESEALSRHRFLVRSGGMDYRIHADAFGWVSRPATEEGLSPAGGARPEHPALREATSWVVRGDAIAFTTADSYRIRVLAPARRAV